MASGPLLAKFSSQAQTSSYVTDYSYVKQEMQKEDILTFLNVLGEYFISLEKSGHVFQKEGVWQPY